MTILILIVGVITGCIVRECITIYFCKTKYNKLNFVKNRIHKAMKLSQEAPNLNQDNIATEIAEEICEEY